MIISRRDLPSCYSVGPCKHNQPSDTGVNRINVDYAGEGLNVVRPYSNPLAGKPCYETVPESKGCCHALLSRFRHELARFNAAGDPAVSNREAADRVTQLLESVVRQYYERVDSNDMDWVIELFSDTARYVRADRVLDGKDSIAHFYLKTRKIRGRHTICGMWINGYGAVVKGIFCGVGIDGQVKDVGFSDFWVFNEDGFVQQRQTYLALGAAYVRD